MSQEILVNVTPREVRVALLENGVLLEVYVERSIQQGLQGNIYKGRVSRLLPGIQAAFVDIGLERAAFLHVSDLRAYENYISRAGHAHVDIRELLHPGEEILVQVYKEPLGSKGARITTLYTIPSRYLVLTPDIFQIAVSQKIADESERERLTQLIQPGEMGGYIFRTVAEGAVADELTTEKDFLSALWQEVTARAKTAKAGDLVYQEIPMVLRVLRDLAGYEVERIRVDDAKSVEAMREFAARYVPKLVDRIELYSGNRPIFDSYSVDDEIQKSLHRKVYLKSGGYLVFDQTEAMTTIDINTGSNLGQGNLEQTTFRMNVEAIEAIARQVRLRNIGGIIIIDFIDMSDPEHKTQLLQALKNAMLKDNARTEVSELTSLGLVQMTRKRTRESLEHILCEPCSLCHRRGSIKSTVTICYEIFRELHRMADSYPWSGFLVLASQKVIDYVLEEESILLADLEAKLAKPIKLQIESTYQQEQYDILPMADKE